MAFGGRSPGGAEGGSVELARGFISLTARYSPALKQISNDFKALENEAASAGIAAGAKLKSGIVSGGNNVPLGAHLRNEFAKAGKTMTSDAEAYGSVIGAALGRGLSAPFRLADRAVGSLKDGIKDTVTGPMAKMIGGATVLGAAFETMSKGWELDVKIDKTRTQLEGLGASVQDIQGFMGDVQEALKNTSNSFDDVADVAKDLFAEGRRGNGLIEELRTVQNMAAIAGKDVESLWGTFEKAHGRDAINPMVLGSLQMQGLPAREELAKALNLKGTADEINEELNKALKAKSGGPTWDQLFQQFAKDFPDAAEKYSKSLEGQLKKVQTNLGKVGGDFLKPLFGGGGGLDGLNSQLEKLDGWINGHQDQIKSFFHEAANAAHELWDVLSNIVSFLKNDFPGGIEGVAIAFGAWKGISAFASVIEALTTIRTGILGVEAEAGATAGLFGAWLGPLTVAAGILATIAATAGSSSRDPIQNIPGGSPMPPGSSDYADKKQRFDAGQTYQKAHGGQMPPGYQHWLEHGGTPPPGIQSHAKGAMIQAPVFPNGIVQWAEPSTGGEAYIPLGLSNRSRSLAIWKETGRRLRAFKGGGFAAAATSGSGTDVGDTPSMDEAGALPGGWGGLNSDWLPSVLNPGIGAPGHGKQDPGNPNKLSGGTPGWWANLGEDAKKKIGLNGAGQGNPSKTFRDWIRDNFGVPWRGGSDNDPSNMLPIFAKAKGGITGGITGNGKLHNWIDQSKKGVDWNSPLGPLQWLLGSMGMSFDKGGIRSFDQGGFTKDQVASDIISAAKARGLNQEQTLAALSVGILESGLGSNSMTNVPQNQSGTVVQGVFQQDSGYNKYGSRTDPASAAKGFVDQFIARGGLNMDPYQGAVKVQVGTYGADYVRSFRGQALGYLDRLGGGVPASGGPGGGPGVGAFGDWEKFLDIAGSRGLLPGGEGGAQGSWNRDHPSSLSGGLSGSSSNGESPIPVDISRVGGQELGKGGGGSGGSGGMSGGLFQSLGGILDNGLKETFLPPGFTDYSQNSWVKSGKAAIGMLMGMGGIGGSGGGPLGGLGGSLGDSMMHPLRGALAQMDPGKAAALGWTQAGAGTGGYQSHGRQSPGQLSVEAAHGGAWAGGGPTFNISGTVLDKGAQDRLNRMQEEQRVTDSRQKSSVGGTSGVGRAGQ